MLGIVAERFPRGGALAMGLMGFAGGMSIQFVLPRMGAIFDNARAEAAGLDNLRIIAHDAIEVLTHQVLPASLTRVNLYFPDPWPKKRHHKRRILQTAFVELLARKLKPGGHFHMATDWEHYAEQMLAEMEGESGGAS